TRHRNVWRRPFAPARLGLRRPRWRPDVPLVAVRYPARLGRFDPSRRDHLPGVVFHHRAKITVEKDGPKGSGIAWSVASYPVAARIGLSLNFAGIKVRLRGWMRSPR